MARLEVRLPISAHPPSWFNKVRLIHASIREFYPDALFRVSISPDREAYPPELPNVIWNVVERNKFDAWRGTRSPYLGTVLDKFMPPFHGDFILSLDADVIAMREFSELFEKSNRLCGVQAHVPPVGPDDWMFLYRICGAPIPAFNHEYSGWGTMVADLRARFGPPYFNSGMVFGSRAVFEKLHPHYMHAITEMRKVVTDTYWFDQFGLAIGMARAGLDISSLPLRYNFPNQKAFDDRHPHELSECRFLHFLRTDTIDRDRDLMDIDAIYRLVNRKDLTGSNEAFRARVEKLLPRIGS